MDCMKIEELKQASEEFRKIEGRASFYDIAVEIAEEHPLQAAVIILATWNMGRFRYAVRDSQNLIDLKNALTDCRPLFEKLNGMDFRSTNFDEIKDIVEEIYERLSKIKGVEYTGASKLMHLFNRKLFVMWDNYIREKYKCGKDAEGYLEFQKKMQEIFGGIEWNDIDKPLTKAIDEYNYVKITLPKLKKQKK